MLYASVADMVLRFGEAEMIRATTPDGAAAVAIVPAPILAALADASAIIDTHLRKRYQVPLAVTIPEINRACCMLARHDLSLGAAREPSEQIIKTRDEVMTWLRSIAKGDVVLDLQEVAPGDESFSAMRTRPQIFADVGAGGCYDDYGGFYNSGGFSGGPL